MLDEKAPILNQNKKLLNIQPIVSLTVAVVFFPQVGIGNFAYLFPGGDE